MNSEKVGTWLGIASNLGVLIGLLLLAVEIRDSNRQTGLAAVQENLISQNESAQALALSSDLASIFVKFGNEGLDALTPEESFRIRTWEVARLNRMELQYFQYRQGFLEQSLYDSMMQNARDRIDYWKELGVGGMEDYEFLRELEQ